MANGGTTRTYECSSASSIGVRYGRPGGIPGCGGPVGAGGVVVAAGVPGACPGVPGVTLGDTPGGAFAGGFVPVVNGVVVSGEVVSGEVVSGNGVNGTAVNGDVVPCVPFMTAESDAPPVIEGRMPPVVPGTMPRLGPIVPGVTPGTAGLAVTGPGFTPCVLSESMPAPADAAPGAPAALTPFVELAESKP